GPPDHPGSPPECTRRAHERFHRSGRSRSDPADRRPPLRVVRQDHAPPHGISAGFRRLAGEGVVARYVRGLPGDLHAPQPAQGRRVVNAIARQRFAPRSRPRNPMDALLADIRYGFRLFRKSPGFSLVAVLTLALGIGANTAIFSVIDALLMSKLPYANPDQVVMVWEDAWQMGFHKNTPAPGNYNDWVRLNHSMSGIAATRGSAVNVTGDGAPEQIIGRGVTPNFFAVLGTAPVIGRTFTDAEDRANAKVVIISYGLWQRRYGGDPSIVGKALLLNGVRWEVIGVMPRAFVFRSRDVDYWMPIALAPNQINTYT